MYISRFIVTVGIKKTVRIKGGFGIKERFGIEERLGIKERLSTILDDFSSLVSEVMEFGAYIETHGCIFIF